ncbi:Putative 115 kDa protein in type-1 retrotransposable element R1DM [Eumeta japonica]|uniref:115 kDa protein in type-1 retrotransposable element R1DM n=1 Tax=Eumeta variegata TaxID=151549 RepID=A0A4C1SSP1_EUMVA|nr:Putative 115 kDa protein in type-1 retrotransposable element R1DM [Eumeta japonica]
MRDIQTAYFRQIAEWQRGSLGYGLSGCLRALWAPRNVVNGLALAEGFAVDTAGAMSGMLRSLCPDDDPAGDSGTIDWLGWRRRWSPPGMRGPCVKEGVFPNVWKSGRLLVIPKGNGKPATDPKAYRPITLLPVLGKILERTLLELVPELRGGISKNQHGFVPGRSTSTALNDILGVSRGSAAKYVQLIFLDISGAFDNAWWPMVLTKVKRGGFPPNLYRLLTDYFTDRRVGFIAGTGVVWKRSTMGCPQGSVLGPALWNVLLDDLLRLPFPAGEQVAYADDVTVLVEASSGRDRAAICASLRPDTRLGPA